MIMKYRKKKTIKGLLVFGLIAMCSCETDGTQQVANFTTNLVMQDEFNADGPPNSAIWNFDIGDGTAQGIPGWGNNELQYYTDRPENVTVENGFLLITANREDFNGSQFTSARIQTEGKFEQRFGRFEARMRLPFGQGMWPAFWMLGNDQNGAIIWPERGEIDIMEYRGQNPSITIGSVHGPGYSGADAISKEFELTDDRFDTGFHVFGIEWGPDFINYYVDDVLYNQITPDDVPEGGEWVFDERPFHILINLAVGGDFVGNPNEETVFPQTMLVDYVRVYENTNP